MEYDEMAEEELQDRVVEEEYRYENLKDELHDLQQKYNLMKTNANQLAKRIDEAIKFIENNMYENYCYCGSEDKLLEILQGSDKE